jgi:thiol:disulfide interchange protein DsbD
MKTKLIVILLLMGFATTVHAQIQHPLTWAYGTKLLLPSKGDAPGVRTFAVHLRATMQEGWHAYSQVQPENAVSQPTKFKFNTSNQIVLVGKVKELGTLIHFEDPGSGLGASEYSGSVDFVQVVKVKDASIKVITGTMTYQTCTDHECLPPEDVNFTIPLK